MIPRIRVNSRKGNEKYHTVKTRIIEPCAMKSEVPFSGMGAKKHSKNIARFLLLRQKKFLTSLREESPATSTKDRHNVFAHIMVACQRKVLRIDGVTK